MSLPAPAHRAEPKSPQLAGKPGFGPPRWLPNALSAARIALVPAWLYLAVSERAAGLAGDFSQGRAALALLLVIGATDVLDGQLARRFGLTTNLGATLDAVADKLATVVAVTFLAFFAVPVYTPVPWWLWAALVLRDLMLGIGWVTIYLRHQVVHVEHRWHGRLSSLLLFALVVVACGRAPKLLVDLGAFAVVALVLPGTWDYLREGLRQLRSPPGKVAA